MQGAHKWRSKPSLGRGHGHRFLMRQHGRSAFSAQHEEEEIRVFLDVVDLQRKRCRRKTIRNSKLGVSIGHRAGGRNGKSSTAGAAVSE